MTLCGYFADVSPLFDEDKYESALSLLPVWRRERAAHLKMSRDRARSVGAFLLLSLSLREQGIAVDPGDIEFEYGDNKKPYLKGYPGLYFNLSHSGERVMCSIGDTENGCDVQEMTALKEKISERFYHPAEHALLCKISDDTEKERDFYRIWALKESYMKATGLGMNLDMRTFDVTEALSAGEAHLRMGTMPCHLKDYTVVNGGHANDMYAYALCGCGDTALPSELKELKL